MAISLNTIQAAFGARKTVQRNGRGLGRKGTTAGRGQKGQTSRSGVGNLKRLGMRKLILSTPKLRGFRSFAPKAVVVNLTDIGRMYIAGEMVTPKTLLNKSLITTTKVPVKVLGQGEIAVAVVVKGCLVSESAVAKIVAAGGKVE